jgi:hypothetical protein
MYVFYVYAYLRNKDSLIAKAGTPYYIGKGKNDRAYEKHCHGIRVPKDKNYIIILEDNLTEIGAFALERRMIEWWGRKDKGTGILLNRTNGGPGSEGLIMPLKSRKIMSMKSEERKGIPRPKDVCLKISQSMMGKNNPNYGKKTSEETKRKLREASIKAGCRPPSPKGKPSWNKGISGYKRGPYKKSTCPHCNKTGGGGIMKQYHFDKCESKSS